jgi:hypothetical protein
MEMRSDVWTVAFILALSACTSSDSAPSPARTPSSAPTASRSLPTPTPTHDHRAIGVDRFGIHHAPDLDGAYLACAREKGFDLEMAEVLVDKSEKPVWAKTGIQVPANVHRPCLIRVGGEDPMTTSYGQAEPATTDPMGTHRAPDLDVPYLLCAREKGFDPQVAEVIVDKLEKPRWVKTGYEVPADVHGPCLVRLGGVDPLSTSYGNAAPPP